MRPAATIGIACHNGEASIEAAIRSAMAQDLREVEILVVDDASTDRSAAIIRRVAEEDARVRVVTFPENRGAAAAYNAIIDGARGENVLFLDADDRALPARARLTSEALKAHPASAIAFCDRFLGRRDGPVVRGLTRSYVSPAEFETYMLDAVCLHHAPDFYRANTDRFAPLRTHGLGGSSAGSGVMTAPAALLREVRFDPALRRYCDTEFNLRAALRGVAAIGVAQPLAVQTVTGGAEKTFARRRVHTSRILARHEAAFRRRGVVYPGHHHNHPPVAPPAVSVAPRATIGLLTFNCEETLPRAIASARAQTEGDLEILILDDASTDATLEIARSYDDRRIRVLESPWNLGAGVNRARLAAAARGAFLAFFDDDDAALPGRIGTQIADLEACPNPAISIASAFRYHRGRLTEAHRSLGAETGPIDAATAQRLVWRAILQHSEGKIHLPRPAPRLALGASLMCGRTDDFRRFAFDPDMRRMQDLEFLARFTAAGGWLLPTETPLVDVFVTRSEEKRWSRVLECCSRLLEKHEGALDALLGVSTAEVLLRNRERLPAIRTWERLRGAFGY